MEHELKLIMPGKIVETNGNQVSGGRRFLGSSNCWFGQRALHRERGPGRSI